MVTTMKKILCLSLLAAFPLSYSTSSFADRPTELENEAPAPVQVQEETPDARPAETSAAPAAKPAETVITQTRGDRVEIPAASVAHIDFPRRGTSEARVEQELGRPLEIIPAVGKPPITRWVYNDRIVYFEYASVIHVVAR